jgi:thymidylate synthase
MQQYLDLLKHVLSTGTRKENRTGVDTLSTFNYNYAHDLRNGFPLLTTKYVPFKSVLVELLWFLSGSNKSEFLERHGVTFWRPWYNKDGTVNAAYGPAWRHFEYPSYCETDSGLGDGPCTRGNDQIAWLVNMLKKAPMARTMVVSAWQPHIAQRPPSKDAYWAPCHCMFICNVQNRPVAWGPNKDANDEEQFLREVAGIDPENDNLLCLHLTQRSADCVLGVPFNLASYALLTHLLARFAELIPGTFGHSLVDAHIYTCKADGTGAEYDHVPGAREQIARAPYPVPKLHISDKIGSLEDVEKLLHPSVTTEEIMSKFVLEGYQSHAKIPFKVAL